MTLNRVLVVDDSEGDQFLAKITIESFDPNAEILQAYDGQEALDLLHDLEPDAYPHVIFLDINMPRMNGHEFLAAYEQDFGSKGVPSVVVMLTSSAQEKDRKATSMYSCVKKYIEKPLDDVVLSDIGSIVVSNAISK